MFPRQQPHYFPIITFTDQKNVYDFCFCRSFCQRTVVSYGDHAVKLTACQLVVDGHPGPAGGLPSAPPALVPSQHQLGFSADCSFPLPGNRNKLCVCKCRRECALHFFSSPLSHHQVHERESKNMLNHAFFFSKVTLTIGIQ